jgi:flagellar biogenesis protein FliO
MATYSVMTGSGVDAYAAEQSGVYSVTATLDFTKINGGAGTVQNDIVQLIQVPANTLVLGVFFKSATASANMTDLDIGDGATTDGYIDGASMATVNDGCSWVTTFNEAAPNTTAEAFSLGKFYTTADTIDLKQNTNATVKTGVLKVKALMIDCNVY